MVKIQKGIRGFFGPAVLSGMCLMTGCRCECEYWTGHVRGSRMYISAKDAGEEEKFAPVEKASVYLFDNCGRYTGRTQASRWQIGGGEPVMIPVIAQHRPLAIVWGNLSGSETLTAPRPGQPVQQLLLRLGRDTQGYATPPGDLYYGSRQLSRDGETVCISPKTARVAVTVKGLPEQDEQREYYFLAGSHYDGYDFTGAPHPGTVGIKLPAVFDGQRGLHTPGALNVIHYPAGGECDTEGLTVSAWDSAGQMLVSVDTDAEGQPLRPQAGKTLNILIRLSQAGTIDVTVVVTPWDEVFQWNEWR